MAAMAASGGQQQEASLPEMPSAVEMDFAETSEWLAPTAALDRHTQCPHCINACSRGHLCMVYQIFDPRFLFFDPRAHYERIGLKCTVGTHAQFQYTRAACGNMCSVK